MNIIYHFGTDGIREKYPFLNDIISYFIAKSFALNVKNNKKVVIGYDSRFNSYSIALAISSALLSEGFKVELSSQYISTPALAFITKYYKCYGFQVTASHNPYNYNGIKILYNGLKIEENLEKKIEQVLNDLIFKIHQDFSNYLDIFKNSTNSHNNFKISNFLQIYIEKLLKYINPYLNNLRGYNIMLDLANGALSKYAANIYKKLGAKVQILNNKPNGFNINQECGATNIELFKKQFSIFSKNYKKTIGFSFDGDGDRVIILIPHNKQILTLEGDTTLLIICKYLKHILNYEINSVALTHMSSLGIQKAFEKENIKVVRTQIGDKYLTQAINEGKADFGAEPSGHIVIPPFLYTGDGILSSLIFLASFKHIDIPQILNSIEKYQQKLINIPVTNKKKFIEKNKATFEKISTQFQDVRLFYRPSGTEDVVRILIESKDPQKINQIESIIQKEVKTDV